MSRTITALFDTRADADAGRARLLAANVDADNVRIHDQASASADGTSMGQTSMGTSSREYATTDGTNQSASQDTGMWASIKNAFLPDEDRHTYEEGIRRGAFLLSADVDEDEIDAAIAALEDSNSIDMDERSASWKNEGWTAPTGATRPAMFGDGRMDNDRMNNDTLGLDRTDNDTTAIPIVEEQLVVGKREVERGGTRIRSYVTEVPVHEQVRLRQERVNVERRPVDRALSDVDADAFRERSIEMTETSEEAVVGKTARVVEEVTLSKTADERVEDINETVRKTDVKIENLSDPDSSSMLGGTDRSSMHNDTGSGIGTKAAGLGDEALGNIKQGLGSLTGNEDLKRAGEAQERSGEMRQGGLNDGTTGSKY